MICPWLATAGLCTASGIWLTHFMAECMADRVCGDTGTLEVSDSDVR
jgi:hypothetical protein